MKAQQIVPQATPDEKRLFEGLVARTRKVAYSSAYRLTGNRDDAEDLVQEAYLRAYRSFARYDRSLPFENWFHRILSNLFIDRLRQRPRVPMIPLDRPTASPTGGADMVLEIADPDSNPETITLRATLDEDLEAALGRLPAEFRTAVTLCDGHGLRYEDIAAAMGTSIGTVRSRIYRGRRMLRRQLGCEEPIPHPARATATPA